MSGSGKAMNCDAFKEGILADPSATFEGAGHAASCDSCAAFQAEVRALDTHILKALAIDVPDLVMPELPRVADDNVVSLPVSRRSRLPGWFAIAASIALAAVVGVRLLGPGADLTLAEEILAHIDHEPGALRVTDVAVTDDRFSAVVRPVTGTMERNIGLISYAQSCVINGREVPHLVIQGEKGPITLLLMPKEMIDSGTGDRGGRR